MAASHFPAPGLLRLLFVLALLPFSWALKFDLQAFPGHSSKHERCIRNFVAKDTLVVVTATVSGQKGDGQTVNMHVSSLLRGLAVKRGLQGASCTDGPWILLLMRPLDQGRGWKRARSAQRCCWGEENGFHIGRGHCVRRLL